MGASSKRNGRGFIHAKVGVGLPAHPRLLRIPRGTARAAALGTWLAALCYSRGEELDGFCPAEALDGLSTPNTIDALVKIGLFEPATLDGIGGYRILRYAEFNETKAEIELRLAVDRTRKGGGKKPVPDGFRSDSDRNGDGKCLEFRAHSEKIPSKFPVSVSGVCFVEEIQSDQDLRPPPASAIASTGAAPEGPARAPDRRFYPADDGADGMTVQAYASAVAAVTGVAQTRPGSNDVTMLVELVRLHCVGQPGQERVNWMESAATSFATTFRGSALSVFKFRDWVSSGRPSAKGALKNAADQKPVAYPQFKHERVVAALPPDELGKPKKVAS